MYIVYTYIHSTAQRKQNVNALHVQLHTHKKLTKIKGNFIFETKKKGDFLLNVVYTVLHTYTTMIIIKTTGWALYKAICCV